MPNEIIPAKDVGRLLLETMERHAADLSTEEQRNEFRRMVCDALQGWSMTTGLDGRPLLSGGACE